MRGGFSFKGVHSSTFGVLETPTNRVLSPQKRRSLIQIPGRSKAFIQEDGGYNPRSETIRCTYALPENKTERDLRDQVRKIAKWLDGVGELTFDFEPEKHYNAFLNSPPPTIEKLQYAEFDLEFVLTPPFAYSAPIQEEINLPNIIQITSYNLNIDVEGTIGTPVRIIIKNESNSDINRIKITRSLISN